MLQHIVRWLNPFTDMYNKMIENREANGLR